MALRGKNGAEILSKLKMYYDLSFRAFGTCCNGLYVSNVSTRGRMHEAPIATLTVQ